MANYDIPEEPKYIESIRKFETTDPGHADLFNNIIQALINNDAFIKKVAEIHVEDKKNPHEVKPEQLGKGYITEGEDGLVLTGKTHGEFKGSFDGNATKDGDGNVIKDTYALNSIYREKAIGINAGSKSIGDYSIAVAPIGESTGPYSIAVAGEASGERSFANGLRTVASGQCSRAEGTDTEASGNSSHAEGIGTSATKEASHAEGSESKATNYYSHAEGSKTTASGTSSHAEGSKTTASGTASHAEGSSTIANGYYAHAEGGETEASGNDSHAEGFKTKASNYASHASGKWNKSLVNGGANNLQVGDVFVIGNGTSTNALSNALRVTYMGDVLGTKAFQSSGADYAEFIKPWADGNEENEDRVGYFVTIRNGFLYKANEGDYIVGITSGNPSIVGNADEDYYWRYERDKFNRIVMEDVPETIQQTDENGNPIFDNETHEPILIETGKTIKNARMKLADDYDPSLQNTYIERKDRKEWDYVGMLGVLPVRDDGTCMAGNLCQCGKNGIATRAVERGFDTYMVIERVSDNVVSVLLK